MKKLIYLTFIQLCILTLTTLPNNLPTQKNKIADIFGEEVEILYIEDTWIQPWKVWKV